MQPLQNISLKPYNTFGIEAKAHYFLEINSLDELRQALFLKGYPDLFLLSGGSNLLLTADLEALVLHLNIKGIRILKEDQDEVVLRAMAGENWHGLVSWTLERDFGGLENLSLIPGNTGTAPIQNIGAYGVELKDLFESCEAMEINTGLLRTFSREECRFGYRDSYFKSEGRGRYVITSVDLRLTKRAHRLNTSYGTIEAELEKEGIHNPGIRDVSRAVVAIRQRKLPDPRVLGNSGSFFKNPVLDAKAFGVFHASHPEAPWYKSSGEEYKIPAGWLIEQSGFKGHRHGDAGVHKDQALVLVNYGNASGKEIWELALSILAEVHRRFGITIEPEVNIVP